MEKQKQVIIIFGPPGAGKGTQAGLLADKMGLYNFETSGIIGRKIAEAKPNDFIEVDREKYYLLKEKEIADEGKLWDPPFVVYFVNEKIKELSGEDKSIIFSGSPRTFYEAEKMMPLIENLYGRENIKIIKLEINPETTIFRNSNRKTCELMRHSILFSKETENLTVCPLDGSNLRKREDDSAEAITVRLNQYAERTFPILEYIEKNGFKMNKINGERSVVDVYKDVLEVIK